jgi:hypothetical protein
MNARFLGGVVFGLAVVAGGVALYLHGAVTPTAPEPPARQVAVPPVTPADGSPADEPMPPSREPLPALVDSDTAVSAAISALYQSPALPDAFYPARLVHRIVATVDNLPREQLAPAARILRPAEGAPLVDGTDGAFTLAGGNAARYARYLDLLRRTDVRQAVGLYHRFQPLFQQAYEELGYPGRSFDERLVVVIDHLLATPELTAAAPLERPSVMYKYVDPGLEKLSVGQKALLRLGHENVVEVKAKLREARALLARPASP